MLLEADGPGLFDHPKHGTSHTLAAPVRRNAEVLKIGLRLRSAGR